MPCENLKFKRVEIMNKSKFLKKSLAALLAVMLIVAMIPLGASAASSALPSLAFINVDGVAVAPDSSGVVSATIAASATTVKVTATLSGSGEDTATVTTRYTDSLLGDTIETNTTDSQAASETTLTLSNYSSSNSVYTIPVTVTSEDKSSSKEYTLKLTQSTGKSTTTLSTSVSISKTGTNSGGIISATVNNTRRVIDVTVAYGYTSGSITVTAIDGATITAYTPVSGSATPTSGDTSYTISSVSDGDKITVTSEGGVNRAFTVAITETAALSTFTIAGKSGEFSDSNSDGKLDTITVTLDEADILDSYDEVETDPSRVVNFATLADTTVTGTYSGTLSKGGKITLTGIGTNGTYTDTLSVNCAGASFDYSLVVNIAPSTECSLLYAQINTEIATISGTSVTAVLPVGENVSSIAAGNLLIRVSVGASVSGDIAWTQGTGTDDYDVYTNTNAVSLSSAKGLVVTAADGDTNNKYYISATNSDTDVLSTSMTALTLMNGTTEYKGSFSGDTVTVTVPYMTKTIGSWLVYATPDSNGKAYGYNTTDSKYTTAIINGTTTVANISTSTIATSGVTDGKTVTLSNFIKIVNKKNSGVDHYYTLVIKFEAAKTGKTLTSLSVTASSASSDKATYRALSSSNTYRATVNNTAKTITVTTAYSHSLSGYANYVTEFVTASGGVAFASDGTQVSAINQYNGDDHSGTTTISDNDTIYVLPEEIAKLITSASDLTTNAGYGTTYTVTVDSLDPSDDGELTKFAIGSTTLSISGSRVISGTIPYSATIDAISSAAEGNTQFATYTVSDLAALTGFTSDGDTDGDGEADASSSTNRKFAFVRGTDNAVTAYVWYNGISSATLVDSTNPLTITAESGDISNTYTFNLKYANAGTEAAITSFKVANTNATISGREIKVTVPYGTSLNGLIPTFTVSTGATVQVGSETITSGTTPVDFTNPVTLYVTSEDASKTNSYVVTATVAEQFSDVTSDKWYYNYVMTAASEGIVAGYGDGTFRPNANVTRAEFAIMLVGMLQADTSAYTDIAAFPDTTTIYASAKKAIAYCADKGYISGFEDGNFRPNENITRQQAASILKRALGLDGTPATLFNDDAKIAGWAKTAVNACKAAGIFVGDENGNFNPTSNLTRAEAAKVMVDSIGK